MKPKRGVPVVRGPGRHGHPPEPVPPREPDNAAERRLRSLAADAAAAEERLKERIREANGLTGDIKTQIREYREAKAVLDRATEEIKRHTVELVGSVQNMLSDIVNLEVGKLREEMGRAITREKAAIHRALGSVKESLEDQQAQLLGEEDAQSLIDSITQGVFTLMKKELEEMMGNETRNILMPDLFKRHTL